MKYIPLTKHKQATIDDEDFERVSQHKWCFNGTYATRRIGTKLVFMQNVIMNTTNKLDHKDANGLNNQKENLRPATFTQNGQNRKLNYNNKSGYKGVYYMKRDMMWYANIRVNKVLKHLGRFRTAEEAAMTYNKAATSNFGEFARLNVLPVKEAISE